MNKDAVKTYRPDILQFLIHFKRDHDGAAPTRREMAAEFSTSTSVITYHLRLMAESGEIELIPGISRGIRVRGGRWVYEP